MVEPAAVDLDGALRHFGVPEADHAGIRFTHDQVCVEPALAQWVTDAAATLRAALGRPSPPPVLEPRPDRPQEVQAYLPVLAFAAALPALRAFHEGRSIPVDVTAASVRDVGRMLRRNRLWEGSPGLGDELAGWLTRHLTGSIYELGRLQYERVRLDAWTGTRMLGAGLTAAPGDLALSLHVPQTGTPLTPQAVEESLATARRFFRRRFPEERLRYAVCHSWLLDPQLAEYLPDASNVVRFQQRFVLAPPRDDDGDGAGDGDGDGDGDTSIRTFVFGDTTSVLADLPQHTTLERAVVLHLADGRHWQVATGWLDLRRGPAARLRVGPLV